MTSRRLLVLVIGLQVMAVTVAPALEGQDAPIATRTKAGKGLVRGAAVGSVATGLAFGVLSTGLCDAADCSGSFAEGFLAGAVFGALAGGLTGLVIGAGFPSDGRAVGGWSGGARVGIGGPRDADARGIGPLVEVYALRSITDRTSFGVAAEYLGSTSRRSTYTIADRDGSPVLRTEDRRIDVTGLRVVAVRMLGTEPRTRGYLVGRVGLHPTIERWTFSGGGPGLGASSRSFVLAPGGGVGVGLLLPVGAHWSLSIEGRGDAVVGVGSDGVLPVTLVSVGLFKGR